MSTTQLDGATAVASKVLETPAADPRAAREHFAAKLSCETDASDVQHDRLNGTRGFAVVDARSAESYAKGHIPGALSLPYRTISPETTARLSKGDVLVTYCTGPGCNAGAKAALRLADLGFRVKEILGGFESWKEEGFPVETGS